MSESIDDIPDGIFEPEWDTPIWRYITFYQFVSLLKRNALYFNRADGFSDPFEGSLPLPNTNERQGIIEEFERAKTADDVDEIASSAYETYRKFTFLNCWHIRDRESAFMWELYSDQGIAIKSTARKLRESIENSHTDVQISRVNYIDYEEKKIDEEDTYSPFVHKRLSYSNEKELRAIIQETPNVRPQRESSESRELYIPIGSDVTDSMLVPGKFVSVKLDELISEIYISPARGGKFEELVKMLIDENGLDVEITRSELDSDPVY
ncbi:hypothetical protein [Halanaeroarchaeum sulfurireducens]|uniref:DUF2971 domain-containing protein n=1 Tax=Halanaeroarchaeum sulfurireducens TaxID=1604004 RepID=A0A0F7PGH7_9EURY|nr:hypothetical protein [Halanaeroarchaeum sulfurireducens]AKH98664.1 hypothetical protein HLASF_3038 [Halanaeroarchaeum sulfurireducens]